MTEPQVWTIIGTFAASMGTIITLVLMTVNAKFKIVDAKFDAVDARFDAFQIEMREGFARVERRLDSMDRDINVLTRKGFGLDTE